MAALKNSLPPPPRSDAIMSQNDDNDNDNTPAQLPAEEEASASNNNNNNNKRKSALAEIEIDVSQPEPPSKRARRALKKGKPLPPKPASSDDEGDEEDDADDKEENVKDGDSQAPKDKKEEKEKEKEKGDKKKTKKDRSPYGAWIGNMRFSTTKAELRGWLVERSGGAISAEAITRVHMPGAKKEKEKSESAASHNNAVNNKGFAYVDFATYEASVAAMALSETELNGRRLLIKDSKSFEGRPAAAKSGAGEQEDSEKTKQQEGGEDQQNDADKTGGSTKIFVGNLSFATTEDDVRAHFAPCGAVRWVKVATFEDTGKCKGYGWVSFEQAEAAAWAVKGFVKVKEEAGNETEADFPLAAGGANNGDGDGDGDGNGEKEEGEGDAATTPVRKIKTRKWWVNQLLGRRLKIELAEDDQVRYKKRFGKGAQKPGQKPGQKQEWRKKPQDGAREEEGGGNTAATGASNEAMATEKKELRLKDNIAEARLYGGLVAPQGKKITF